MVTHSQWRARYDETVSASTPEATLDVVGPYVVYEQLGKGGMATVHRAETQGVEGFRRPIALKRLLSHLAADPDLVRSFIHEARLASHLHHTNVAQTYDLGRVGDTYFIAMEYVPGATLAQILRQCDAAAGLIPIPVVLSIVTQMCDGLDHAHNLCDASGKPLGIIHRDVSPANVIVSNTGIVKLIDFGIAKAESSGVNTQTGMIKGKFGYVAPEYTSGQLDARCDLWAVGVVAHELLTGRRLFQGQDNFETITRVREGKLDPPSRTRPLPPELDAIVMTALQRDPDQRWQSAAAMRNALANFAHDARMEVGNAQVIAWVEWAFTQVSHDEDSGLARVIDMLAEPSSVSMHVSIDDREVQNQTPTVPREKSRQLSVARAEPAPHHLPTSKMKASRGPSWVAVIIVLLALGGAAAVVWMEYYELTYELAY